MKLNPIFESSARRRMRTGKTALILTAYMAALLVFSLSRLSVFFGQGVTVGRMRLGTEAYIWQTALQLALIVVVAPALGAVSIAGERERQTFDLLLVTGVGTRKIVLGKLMESFAFIALLILAGAPVMMLAHVTAGIPVLRVLETLIYLMAIALEALAVGMVCSALCRRTLSAMMMTYLAIGLLGGGKLGNPLVGLSLQDRVGIVHQAVGNALDSLVDIRVVEEDARVRSLRYGGLLEVAHAAGLVLDLVDADGQRMLGIVLKPGRPEGILDENLREIHLIHYLVCVA